MHPKTRPYNFENATHFKIMRKAIIILISIIIIIINNNNNNNIHNKVLNKRRMNATLQFVLNIMVQDNETRFQNSPLVTYKKR